MKIEILGTGCHDCVVLDLLVGKVLQKLGITGAEIARVSEERQIMRYITLDAIPGLAINGKLVSARAVPDEATLTTWLKEALSVEGSARQ
jgi:hypothetical protein